MRKCLLLFAMLILTIGMASVIPGETQSAEETGAAETAAEPGKAGFGIWTIKYYIDEFGDPTEDGYVTTKNRIQGKFSNTATTNSELDVCLYLDENVGIRLFEYGSNIVKGAYSNGTAYDIIVLSPSKEKTKMTGTLHYGGDRIFLDSQYVTDFYKILIEGGEVKVSMVNHDHPASKYLFTIDDSSCIENALKYLYEDMHVSDAAGSVSNGYYINKEFNVRIKEGTPLVFNSSKVREMNVIYAGNGLCYTSEAYATCEGGILNITYVPSEGRTDKKILNDYLTDCGAENIGATAQETLGGEQTVYADSSINGTNTRTFCRVSEEGALLFCIYYGDGDVLEKITSSFVGDVVDSSWKEETRQIGSYKVTTPDQYIVDESISSDFYTCIVAPDGSEMNIFVMDGTVEEIVETDTSETKLTRQETVTSDDGKTAQYLETGGVQNGVKFTSYELLWQGDPDHVMKYVIFSRNDNENHMEDFLSALALTQAAEAETETE